MGVDRLVGSEEALDFLTRKIGVVEKVGIMKQLRMLPHLVHSVHDPQSCSPIKHPVLGSGDFLVGHQWLECAVLVSADARADCIFESKISLNADVHITRRVQPHDVSLTSSHLCSCKTSVFVKAPDLMTAHSFDLSARVSESCVIRWAQRLSALLALQNFYREQFNARVPELYALRGVTVRILVDSLARKILVLQDFLPGHFVEYVDILGSYGGDVVKRKEPTVMAAMAFSHFTFDYSEGKIVLVNLRAE